LDDDSAVGGSLNPNHRTKAESSRHRRLRLAGLEDEEEEEASTPDRGESVGPSLTSAGSKSETSKSSFRSKAWTKPSTNEELTQILSSSNTLASRKRSVAFTDESRTENRKRSVADTSRRKSSAAPLSPLTMVSFSGTINDAATDEDSGSDNTEFEDESEGTVGEGYSLELTRSVGRGRPAKDGIQIAARPKRVGFLEPVAQPAVKKISYVLKVEESTSIVKTDYQVGRGCKV